MSVIITGMDMPDSCFREYPCPLSNGEEGSCQYSSNITTTYDIEDGRPKNCPLKSIDGLIKKIVNSPSDVGQGMYKTKYDGAARRQNEIIEIIKEYCEVAE